MDHKPNKLSTKKGYTFAHVFLFKCPHSGEPLAAACVSNKKSLEEVDSHPFEVHCNCGWSGKILGVNRLRSWVEDWDGGMLASSILGCT
jgi:hypothetical protein